MITGRDVARSCDGSINAFVKAKKVAVRKPGAVIMTTQDKLVQHKLSLLKLGVFPKNSSRAVIEQMALEGFLNVFQGELLVKNIYDTRVCVFLALGISFSLWSFFAIFFTQH